MRLHYEKLDVYQAALDFVRVAEAISVPLWSKRWHLADQLARASVSVTLNIAEGAGEFSKREKTRFYRMALRSATECGAVLDICQGFGASRESLESGRVLLVRIISMLTRLCRR